MTIISLINTLDLLQQQFPTIYQLIDLSLKSVFIVVVALTLRFFFRHHSASTLFVFWLSAIISLLLLPLFSRFIPEIPISFSVSQETLGTPAIEPVKILSGEQYPIQFLPGQRDLLRVIEFIYLGVTVLMIGYLVCGIVRMLFISQLAKSHIDPRATRILNNLKSINGVHCQIQLLTSSRVYSPVTWGIWRHKIIFPTTTSKWDDELLSHVIGHELGHIQRKDWVSYILARLTTCLYWPNPLVWLAQKNMVLEAEKSCDDIAVDNSQHPFSYAENLVTIASAICNKRQTSTPAMYGNGEQLKFRVQYALRSGQARANFDFSDIFPNILLIAVIAAPISALSLDFHLLQQTPTQRSDLIALHYFPKEQHSAQNSDGGRFGVATIRDTLTDAPLLITTAFRSIGHSTENFGQYSLTAASSALINLPTQVFTDTRPLLISNPQPHYPDSAKNRGVEGYVVAEYSISPSGSATNINIVESAPARVFDRSVIRAIAQYSYHPMLVKKRGSTENIIRRKFIFSLAQEI